MRALTLTQPWAGLVASGIKLIENRPRRIIKREDFGTRFAIHASREIDEDVYARMVQIAPEFEEGDTPWWYPLTRIKSSVIAVATLVDVVEHYSNPALAEDQRRWFFGPIGYVLRDVVALTTPVPCRGALGFWTLPDNAEHAVRLQLREQKAS